MFTSTFPGSINLIRYLIVWRVNHSLVQMPHCFPAELSWALGTTIAERLPTNSARPWRKALAAWDEYGMPRWGKGRGNKPVPDISWPLESTLFVYPGKTSYGQGELIFWELKLLGESADHGYFLEVILPAMEEASRSSDARWKQPKRLWGRFDIHAIYVARGARWQPLVGDGRFDLSYRVSPNQWAEGLTFGIGAEQTFNHLNWLTPFDPGNRDRAARRGRRRPSQKQMAIDAAPSLPDILESLGLRLNRIISGKSDTPANIWGFLDDEGQTAVQEALAQAGQPSMQRKVEPAPKEWPGRLIGRQRFSTIPASLIPYLELASILHIGKYTHFGCGTFDLN